MSDWLLLSWLTPLLLAPLTLVAYLKADGGAFANASRRWLPLLPAVAPLPAIFASLLLPDDGSLSLSWLFLGSEFGLSAFDKPFLFAAGLVYFCAGIYLVSPSAKEGRSPGFIALFLLAMAGNLLLILARDPASFYLGFTLMSLSAYGLVIFKRGKLELFAGKVYLVMTLISEVALLSAFLLFIQRTGLAQDLIPGVGLLLPVEATAQGLLEQAMFVLGFGIKGGLLGLHMWLPLAHPAAPVPASAVLSGVMIKAALIGLMRYLPIGEQSLVLGEWLLLLSLSGALLAGVVATVQRDPKVVLAYSSVAKMGFALSMIAVMLLEPDSVPFTLPLLGLFALYHGLCKAALFLGVGWFKQHVGHSSATPLALLLMLLPAWILVGAPYGAGAQLKANLYAGLDSLGGAAHAPYLAFILDLAPALLLLSVLMVCRLMWLLYQHNRLTADADASAEHSRTRGRIYSVGVLLQLSAILLLSLVAVAISIWQGEAVAPSLYDLFALAAAIPIVGAVVLSDSQVGRNWSRRLPPGDLLILLMRASRVVVHSARLALRRHLTPPVDRLLIVATKQGIALGAKLEKNYQRVISLGSQQVTWMAVFVILLLAVTLPAIRG